MCVYINNIYIFNKPIDSIYAYYQKDYSPLDGESAKAYFPLG
ncbi:hypothetical protein SAMN05216167_1396 [Spirosoma endophyticum]|uniref:Uncharacterized protein n=1 Tax=Spirosoma endophyticum TaxID=662367 RepID=A0A1I2H9R8_9BACT|nr:hypothetical protein SAMN05216167_1396 [Spirosoma endophyticum]